MTALRQDTLRQRVKDYIERHGSRQSWFSNQLKISQTHFSLFLKGERDLGIETENMLTQILNK